MGIIDQGEFDAIKSNALKARGMTIGGGSSAEELSGRTMMGQMEGSSDELSGATSMGDFSMDELSGATTMEYAPGMEMGQCKIIDTVWAQ